MGFNKTTGVSAHSTNRVGHVLGTFISVPSRGFLSSILEIDRKHLTYADCIKVVINIS
jgi:hypothetical protein